MPEPEVLLVTFPAVGHVNPTLQFARRLVAAGVSVTLVTSSSALPTLTKSPRPDGLTLATFSDGYDDGFKPGGDPGHYMSEITRCCSKAMTDLITARSESRAPFSCVVYTLLLSWAGEVARGLHLRSVLLWIQPATLFDIYYHYFNGYDDAIKSLGDNNKPSSSLELPGLPPLTIFDFPSFFHPENKFPFALPMYKKHLELLKTEPDPIVLVNTFDELEPGPVTTRPGLRLLAVGPLVPAEIFSAGASDPKPDPVEEWLAAKPEKSVVYVSYGSIAELPEEQVEEIAGGLLEAARPFLWVVRGGEIEPRRREELEKVGKIVAWCDQAKVLTHPSIGCFVTHCGWNSTSESLAAGVAMVGSPHWADQFTNAKLVADVWRTGVRMSVVKRGEMSRLLESVMGDEGEEMRNNAKKWKDLAREAVAEGGSSDKNLKDFARWIRDQA